MNFGRSVIFDLLCYRRQIRLYTQTFFFSFANFSLCAFCSLHLTSSIDFGCTQLHFEQHSMQRAPSRLLTLCFGGVCTALCSTLQFLISMLNYTRILPTHCWLLCSALFVECIYIFLCFAFCLFANSFISFLLLLVRKHFLAHSAFSHLCMYNVYTSLFMCCAEWNERTKIKIQE